MAKVYPVPRGPGQRVAYSIRVAGATRRRFRRADTPAETRELTVQLGELERASRTGLAQWARIDSWVALGW